MRSFRPVWNSRRPEIQFGVWSKLLSCSHERGRNETQVDLNSSRLFRPTWNFRSAWKLLNFPCEHIFFRPGRTEYERMASWDSLSVLWRQKSTVHFWQSLQLQYLFFFLVMNLFLTCLYLSRARFLSSVAFDISDLNALYWISICSINIIFSEKAANPIDIRSFKRNTSIIFCCKSSAIFIC